MPQFSNSQHKLPAFLPMPVHKFLLCLIDNSLQSTDIRIMKHWLWGFSFLLIGLTTAQDSSNAVSTTTNTLLCCDSPKPQNGDWSTEATFYAQTGSNSLRFGISDIKIRKFIASNTVARVRFIASQNNETTIIAGSAGNMERSITEAAFAIAPGFEKHIATTKRLSLYWGAEAIYGINTYEYNLTNSTNGQSFSNGGNFNSKTKGANTIGANLLVGADYYITKGIFVGAEFGYGFQYQSYGENTATSFDGTSTVSRTLPMGSKKGLNLFANPGIRLGIAF